MQNPVAESRSQRTTVRMRNEGEIMSLLLEYLEFASQHLSGLQSALCILLRTTLCLAAFGLICRWMLRHVDDSMPRLSRVVWLAVLLSGWFWLQPVIHVPRLQTSDFRLRASDFGLQEEVSNITPEVRIPMPEAYFGFQTSDFRLQEEASNTNPEVRSLKSEAGGHGVTALPEVRSQKFEALILPTVFVVWFGGMVVSIFLAATGYVRYLSALRNTVPAGDDFAGT